MKGRIEERHKTVCGGGGGGGGDGGGYGDMGRVPAWDNGDGIVLYVK